MTIRASSAKVIETLVADLSSPRAATREAAVVRLTVIGSRAVERLLALAQSSSGVLAAGPTARATAWRTLDGIGDKRALEPALRAIDDRHPDVASAAIGVCRGFLKGARGAAVVDRLAAVAMNRDRPEPVRVAALRVLADLGPKTVGPLWTALADDPSPHVRAEATAGVSTPTAVDVLASAADGPLGDDPTALRNALSRAGHTTELPALLRLVERIRERESGAEGAVRDEWTRTRAAAHVALANRGSRLALYDLRESLDAAAAPLPVEFLAALKRIGDASCLPSIAAAYARAKKPAGAGQDWWTRHLAEAFQAIVKREKLTRRHAVIRKIEKRSKDALEQLWSRGLVG